MLFSRKGRGRSQVRPRARRSESTLTRRHQTRHFPKRATSAPAVVSLRRGPSENVFHGEKHRTQTSNKQNTTRTRWVATTIPTASGDEPQTLNRPQALRPERRKAPSGKGSWCWPRDERACNMSWSVISTLKYVNRELATYCGCRFQHWHKDKH